MVANDTAKSPIFVHCVRIEFVLFYECSKQKLNLFDIDFSAVIPHLATKREKNISVRLVVRKLYDLLGD